MGYTLQGDDRSPMYFDMDWGINRLYMIQGYNRELISNFEDMSQLVWSLGKGTVYKQQIVQQWRKVRPMRNNGVTALGREVCGLWSQPDPRPSVGEKLSDEEELSFNSLFQLLSHGNC